MVHKARKKITIFIVVLIVISSYLGLFYTGVLDRLDLRKNKISIEIDRPIESDDLVEVSFVSNLDTLIIMKNNHIYFSELLVDWYGKDHIIVRRRNKLALITYEEFKRKSWEKVKIDIYIKSDIRNHMIIKSSLSTIYKNINRTDTL